MPWSLVIKKRWYQWRTLWVLAVLLLLSPFLAPRAIRRYERWSSERYLGHAREFLAKGDHKHAILSARAALNLNPGNAEARRIFAQTLESLGSPAEAILLRSQLDTLLPGDAENLLAWASDALKAGDLSTAQRAISKVPPADRNATYHDVAAAIAIGKRDPAIAETHWTEAARLAPDDSRFPSNLAILHLSDKSPDVRAGALDFLNKATGKPGTGIQARRTLLADAMRQKNAALAKELADALVADPAANFADRLLRLTTLRAVNDPKASEYLAELEKTSAATPEELAQMLGWMAANDLALIALEWLATLPAEALSKPPVCVSVARIYVKASEWPRLRASLEGGNWLAFDYLRRAFLARALDRLSEPDAGAEEWKQALAAVQSGPDLAGRLETLAKLALEWRWKERAEELLWRIADFPTCPKWVLDSLWVVAMQQGDTVHLQRIARLMARSNNEDLAMRNNYIFLSLLTRTAEGNPHKAAEVLFKEYPGDSNVASTYGLSLFQQGRPAEAVAIMGGLKPEAVREPQVALYYGIFLTAVGQDDKAKEFLSLATAWPMLPEEKSMLTRVKATTAEAAAEAAVDEARRRRSGTDGADSGATQKK